MRWPTLLYGNGASINASSSFSYASIRTNAQLAPDLQNLFNTTDTPDFESVLASLWSAKNVMSAVGEAGLSTRLASMYDDIRAELLACIRRTHPEALDLGADRIARFANAFTIHDTVFTLNYDLLGYWARMREASGTTDFFSRTGPDVTFDLKNTLGRTEKEYFNLHGGIHLWRDAETHVEGKWTTGGGPAGYTLLNVLNAASRAGSHSRVPLFVSEGTGEQKARTIRSSAYLSYCLARLSANSEPMTIFGTEFAGGTDTHIISAISANRRPLAVGIWRGAATRGEIASRQARLQGQLAGQGNQIAFFDSSTHPLGTASPPAIT